MKFKVFLNLINHLEAKEQKSFLKSQIIKVAPDFKLTETGKNI